MPRAPRGSGLPRRPRAEATTPRDSAGSRSPETPARTVAEQLRTRRMDHAARQSEFSWVRRFPAHGVGPRRPGACRSVPRLLFSRCGARTLLFRSRLYDLSFSRRTLRHRSGGISGTWEIHRPATDHAAKAPIAGFAGLMVRIRLPPAKSPYDNRRFDRV